MAIDFRGSGKRLFQLLLQDGDEVVVVEPSAAKSKDKLILHDEIPSLATTGRCQLAYYPDRGTLIKGKGMSVQSVSIGSMFGWIVDSFGLLKRKFGSLLLASAVTLVLGLLMILPMWLLMFVSMKQAVASGAMTSGAMPMAANMPLFFAMYAITLVIGLLLFPPLLVGWFRLCRDIDQGNPVRGLDIVKPYRDSQLWFRSLRFALLAFLIYIAVFGVFAVAFSGVIFGFMQQVAAQQAAAISGATPVAPHFPAAFVLAYFGFIGLALLLQFVYMLGFAEISLRPTTTVEALKLALAGVFRNALKLVVFLFCALTLFSIVLFIVALLLGLVIWLASLIHPALSILIALMFYLPFLLCMYPLMFAGSYFVWKSILAGETSAAVTAGGSEVAI